MSKRRSRKKKEKDNFWSTTLQSEPMNDNYWSLVGPTIYINQTEPITKSFSEYLCVSCGDRWKKPELDLPTSQVEKRPILRKCPDCNVNQIGGLARCFECGLKTGKCLQCDRFINTHYYLDLRGGF